MTFDYSTAPPEYADARREVHRTMLNLTRATGPLPTAPKTETAVADALESLVETVGLVDGTRSGQIVTWRDVFLRTLNWDVRETPQRKADKIRDRRCQDAL